MIRSDDNQAISHDDSLTPVRRAVAMMIPSSEMISPDGVGQGAANLDGYLHALRRTWLWCLIAGVVLAAVTTVAVWNLASDKYTAAADLQAFTVAPRVLNAGTAQPAEKYETFISNIQQLLQSPVTLTQALSNPTVKDHPLVRAEAADPENWLLKNLRVSNPRNSEILRVAVTVPDPDLAANLANSVVAAYMKEVVDKEQANRREKLQRLEVHQGSQAEAERTRRAKLEELAKTLGSTDVEALSLQQQIRLTQAQQIKTELAKTQVERMRTEAEVKVLAQREQDFDKVEVPAGEVDLMVAADPIGRFLLEDIAAMESGNLTAGSLSKSTNGAGSSTNATLGRGRQMIQELQDRLDRVRKSMALQWKAEQRRELRTLSEQKLAESQSLADLEANLKKEADKYDEEFKMIGGKSYQVEIENEEIKRLNVVMDNISREIEFEKIEQGSEARVKVISPAIKPAAPNRPGRLVLAGMAGMLVFVLPGIGMVLLDVRSQRVSSVNEVQERLGLPMFGSVPMLPSRVTRGLDGASKRGRRWQAVLSEAVSGIRANLLRVSDVRVVMVTSSVGGEGKTTVATQLAMSLARIGKRTALVDFDLPRPAVNNVFDLPLEPGICDVLRSDCSLEDIVHEVQLPNLTVITSGIADASSARYMNSPRLAEVLDELRGQFDYVIVDGSPLVPVADARVVSRYVDGAICCVLRDVSRLKLIRQAADILTTFDVRLLGTVVTAKQDTYYLSPNGDREERVQSTVG
ncbi:MAG: polysaccharide biosynthesis tyrosine autokinase [Pirellulaceae bacterium]